MPPDALVRTPREGRGREPWDAYMELLAQLLEVTSVGVAGMRLKKPIKVPRPNKRRGRRKSFQTVDPSTQQVQQVPSGAPNPYSAAINMLTASQQQRRFTVVQGGGGDGEQETA